MLRSVCPSVCLSVCLSLCSMPSVVVQTGFWGYGIETACWRSNSLVIAVLWSPGLAEMTTQPSLELIFNNFREETEPAEVVSQKQFARWRIGRRHIVSPPTGRYRLVYLYLSRCVGGCVASRPVIGWRTPYSTSTQIIDGCGVEHLDT